MSNMIQEIFHSIRQSASSSTRPLPLTPHDVMTLNRTHDFACASLALVSIVATTRRNVPAHCERECALQLQRKVTSSISCGVWTRLTGRGSAVQCVSAASLPPSSQECSQDTCGRSIRAACGTVSTSSKPPAPTSALASPPTGSGGGGSQLAQMTSRNVSGCAAFGERRTFPQCRLAIVSLIYIVDFIFKRT